MKYPVVMLMNNFARQLPHQ